MRSMSSPGWYGREPATSEPSPRRALCSAPNGKPSTRRRGISGNVVAVKHGHSAKGPDALAR